MPRKPPGPRSLEELWMESLQKLTGHISHELKGALNGVSVNLEVVRGRAERTGTPIVEVQKFAAAAVDQLTAVIKMTGALLAVGRISRGPAEVSVVARQVVSLLEDTLRSEGARMEIQVEGGLAAATGAPLVAVRLALVEAIYAAATQKRDVSIRVRGVPTPRVEIHSTTDVKLSDEITAALAGVRITIDSGRNGPSIVFPGPAETPTEDA